MNLKAYYQKIRDLEQKLVEPFVVLVSRETPDGGKEGLLTEVPRRLAVKMIADERAQLASEGAAKEFHENNTQAKRAADQEAAVNKAQVIIVPAPDIKRANRPAKE